MASELVGVLGFLALLALMALRVPVGVAMLVVGFLGTAALSGWTSAAFSLSGQTYETASFYDLSVLPLFILMGNLASAAGLSRDLYDAAYRWIGHLRGGLASATVVGCAGFSALSGSSIAAAITMGRVALPEMKRFGYGDRLATGTVAAGGTLGILIPPSTGFVVYAILTQESIGRLFLAGVLPGLLLMLLFIATVGMVTLARPAEGPPGPRSSMAERWRASLRALGIVTIILLTIGGIYTGVFTIAEASGVGAFFALVMLAARGGLTFANLRAIGLDTLVTTGVVFMILIGASVFSPFISLSKLPEFMARLLADGALGAYGTLALIILLYVLLGMFIEGLSMLVITLPIVFPLVKQFGFDPIWFGVVVVILLEIGLISPPVGVNCFVVKNISEGVKLETVFAGIMPFWVAMLVCVAILVAFPQIATVLPNAMYAAR